MAVDSIYVEIQAQLASLRAQMSQAERVVDESTKRMDVMTSRQGPFAGFNRIGRGIVGIAGARAGIEAFGAIVNVAQGDTDELADRILAMSNALTFGLAGALQSVIDDLTGFTAAQKAATAEVAEFVEAQQALSKAHDVRREAEQQQAITEANTPEERAMAKLAAARADIREQALEMQTQGVPRQIREDIVRARTRTAEIEATRDVYGNHPSDLTNELLRQIAQSVSRGP